MIIKKFNELNENLGYKDFFGKEVLHEQALQKRIRDYVHHIIMDERQISEKSFKQLDEIFKEVKDVFDNNEFLYKSAYNYYNKSKRLQWLAEEIYDDYFKK